MLGISAGIAGSDKKGPSVNEASRYNRYVPVVVPGFLLDGAGGSAEEDDEEQVRSKGTPRMFTPLFKMYES